MISTSPVRRKASREDRREQLIEATISTIARRGFAQTTLTDVAVAAGVSHGLVNFHFQTKEKLLAETLLYMSDEYRSSWFGALAAAGPAPAQQLDAVIQADFSEPICTPDRLAAWCAFWGEAQSRPLYMEHCGGNDRDYIRAQEQICEAIAAEGKYRSNAKHAARVLRVTIQGVWLDMIFSAAPYSKEEAMKTVYFCAAALFPKHFDESGLIRR